MKFLISHRGNINGKNVDLENNPLYVLFSLRFGYDVEIDVHYENNDFYLGHDKPQYLIDEKFLENEKFWCHAKNLESFEKMLSNKKIHCFYHNSDDVILTSKGYVWTYPKKKLINNSICVLPELGNQDLNKCIGICSDFIEKYK